MIGIAQSIACNSYILAMVRSFGRDALYEKHYPLGTPNDNVSEHIPESIAEDFREALRCRFVNALCATVVMCRRALQVSCNREKAEGKSLKQQIDNLAAKQLITEPLKQMAHRIRLLGNEGAHGDYSDIDASITAQDADDAITFMHHYLQHVYILTKLLEEKK